MKKKLYTVLLLLTFCISALFAQVKQGELTISGLYQEVGYSIVQTKDGGYAITGYTQPYADTVYGGVYVIKLDEYLNLQWTKIVGGLKGDWGFSIIQTQDDGYAITGFTESYGVGMFKTYVVKLDSVGKLEWTKTIGGTKTDWAYSIVQTTDKGYAIAGRTTSFGDSITSAVCIIRLDSVGNVKWTKTMGGSKPSEGFSIVQTKDKGFAITGSMDTIVDSLTGAAYRDVYVIKLDSNGILQWDKTIGGPTDDEGYSIIQASDGGYAVTGYTNSYGAGGRDVYIIKLDTKGNLKWTKTIGGGNDEGGSSIVQTSDKGYVIAGGTTSFGLNNSYVYVVKLDSAGIIQWTKIVGGSYDDEGYSIIQTKDGGYAITGMTAVDGVGVSHVYVVKLDSAGNTCLPSINDSGRVSSGGIVRNGGIESSVIPTVISDSGKVNNSGVITYQCIVASVQNINSAENNIIVYPNPSNGIFSIEVKNEELRGKSKIEVYNVLGEKVFEETLRQAQGDNKIDISSQPSGIYLYRVTDNVGSLLASGKLIID